MGEGRRWTFEFSPLSFASDHCIYIITLIILWTSVLIVNYQLKLTRNLRIPYCNQVAVSNAIQARDQPTET